MGIQFDAPPTIAGAVDSLPSQDEQTFRSLKRNERLVYDALCQSDSPLKAYELLDVLQDRGLRAPMTIYRALEALTAKGYVKKIESLNAFAALVPGDSVRARAFLICRDCLQAKEVALDESQVAGLFAPLQVSAADVRIEAFGDCDQVCGDCAKTTKSQ